MRIAIPRVNPRVITRYVGSRIRRSLFALPVLAVMAMLLPLSAHAATDRIARPLSESQVVQLSGNVNGHVRNASDEGRLASNTQLSGIRLVFQPSAAQQADLDTLLAAQQDPKSPLYHQWINNAQYAARFGLSQSDLGKITTWLESQGLTVTDISPAANSVTVSGTAVQAEQAFRTEIHTYSFNGETHFANSTSPSLPEDLAGMTAGILGLHNFYPHPKAVRAPSRLSTVNPKFTSSETGNHYITPGDFATIYNVTPLYTAGNHGEGQNIAIIGQTAIYTNDITAFRTAASLPTMTVPASTPSSSQYVTSPGSCSTANATLCLICSSSNTSKCTTVTSNDLPEADLDIELSSGVAYNANIRFVYDPENFVFNAYDYAIENDVAPIVSISYGECENYTASNPLGNKSDATAFQTYTVLGNSKGITTIAAAGDDGAADCDYTTGSTADDAASDGLQVDIPADIPQVTAMGGSEFYPDAVAASNSSGYANSTWWTGTTNADTINSAISYIPEVVWNDNAITVATKEGFSAGGGGISQFFSKPSWQTVALTAAADSTSGMRDVPDLALSASANHDAYLVCTQNLTKSGNTYTGTGTSCTSGFRTGANGDLTAYGGTSVAAPSFAGILALMEQRNSTQYGNLNTLLYSLAGGSGSYSSGFHDIVPVSSGSILYGANNNDDPCKSGTQNCSSSGYIGYTTLVGYDLATGLGSVNAANLASEASSLTPTTTTLTYSPTTVTTATSPVTLTATVASASSSVTTTPGGTVTFTVNGTTVSGSPVTLNNGVANITTSFPNGGTQSVVATYSGSSTFIASSNSVSISVTASGSASTTTSVTPNPTSLELGQSLTLNSTATSTTTGSITGTVTYTLGSTLLGTASVSAASSTTGVAAPLTIVASTDLGFSTGTNTITATYNGNSAYSSSSGTAGVTVSAAPSFTVTATPMTITSTANGSVGTTTVTITAVNGYTGTVDTPCNTATSSNISVSPNTLDLYYNCATTISSTTSYSNVALSSTTTSATLPLTFELDTAAANGVTAVAGVKRVPTQSSRLALYTGTAALAGLCFFSFSNLRRRKLPLLLCLMLFGMVFAGMGCSSSNSSSNTNNSGTTTSINTAGTYTITVILQDTNGLSEQGTFPLTVQ